MVECPEKWGWKIIFEKSTKLHKSVHAYAFKIAHIVRKVFYCVVSV